MLTTLTATLIFSRLIQPAPDDLTAAVKTQTVESLIREMNQRYVDPAIAKKMELSLKNWIQTSEYTALTDPVEFAKSVNTILKKETVDAHLRFR